MSVTGEPDGVPGGGPVKVGRRGDGPPHRHVRGDRGARRARAPRPDRRGAARRPLAPRRPGRDAREPGGELPRHRRAAAAARQRPPVDRPVPGVRDRGRPPRPRGRERRAVRAVLRGRGPPGPGARPAVRDERGARRRRARRSCRLLAPLLAARTTGAWVAALEAADVPCGPINDLAQVFADAQVRHRGLRVEIPRPGGGTVPVVASPIRLSRTPVRHEHAAARARRAHARGAGRGARDGRRARSTPCGRGASSRGRSRSEEDGDDADGGSSQRGRERTRLEGVFAPVLTPFGRTSRPTPRRFARHCRWLLAHGCAGARAVRDHERGELALASRSARRSSTRCSRRGSRRTGSCPGPGAARSRTASGSRRTRCGAAARAS